MSVGDLQRTASFILKLSGFSRVLCSTTQLMSFPLSLGVGTMRYSLDTVTVLSVPAFFVVVSLPLAVVTQDILAAGSPFADSHLATVVFSVPASTDTVDAEFSGLADDINQKLKKQKLRRLRDVNIKQQDSKVKR